MKRVSRASFAAGTSAAFASVMLQRGTARAAQFTWKWGMDLGPDHSMAVRAVQACGRIRKDTNGQVDITVFPNSALGNISKMFEQLRLGAIELTSTGGDVIESVVPMAGIDNVAFAFPRRETAFAAMDGDLGRLVRAEVRKQNVMLFEHVFENGFREFTSNVKPIHTVADLDGLKVRTSPGKLRFDTFKSLGCSPITIVPNELYTALKTRLADAMESSLPVIESYKVFEVQKYCSITNHMWGAYWNCTNLDKWSSLPPQFQQIVAKRLGEAAILQRRDNGLMTQSLADVLRRQGMTFNSTMPETFRARLVASGYYTRWKEEFGDAAWTALEKYSGKLG